MQTGGSHDLLYKRQRKTCFPSSRVLELDSVWLSLDGGSSPIPTGQKPVPVRQGCLGPCQALGGGDLLSARLQSAVPWETLEV